MGPVGSCPELEWSGPVTEYEKQTAINGQALKVIGGIHNAGNLSRPRLVHD